MILKIKNKEINYMLHHHLYINMVYLLNKSINNYKLIDLKKVTLLLNIQEK